MTSWLHVLLQLKNVMSGASKTPGTPTSPGALPSSPAIKAGVYRAQPFIGVAATPVAVRACMPGFHPETTSNSDLKIPSSTSTFFFDLKLRYMLSGISEVAARICHCHNTASDASMVTMWSMGSRSGLSHGRAALRLPPSARPAHVQPLSPRAAWP